MSVEGSRLDPWIDSYAGRARTLSASAIRALFSVASRPEVVSLAGGMPYVQALSMDQMADIAARVTAESQAGVPTADLVFLSAMDLAVKLANDGYGQSVALPQAVIWPDWANWRDTVFAITGEPAVFVYHRPAFADGPPQTRAASTPSTAISSAQGGPTCRSSIRWTAPATAADSPPAG